MSDSDSREENPIDTLILKKAAKRKASRPADDDDSDVEAAPLTEEASVIIEIPSSSVEDVSVSVVEEKANKRTPKKKKKQKTNATDGPGKKNPSAARSPAAKKSSINVKQLAAGIPFGVLLVDKGVITRDAEVSKLLRVPRYFDEALEQEEQTSRRCFNCGMVGHAIRDCTNAARKKPCHLCARLGHDGQDCPNRLCFRCGKSGHMSRDCCIGRSDAETAPAACLRCGLASCNATGKGDWWRYEGACSSKYTEWDLRSCKCYVCGSYGHLCCHPTPQEAARKSCYVCGSVKHMGETCQHEDRPQVMMERSGDMRRAQMEAEAEFHRIRDMDNRYPAGGGSGGGRGGRGGRGGGFNSFGRDRDSWQGGGGGRGGGGQMQRPHSAPDFRDTQNTFRGNQYSQDTTGGLGFSHSSARYRDGSSRHGFDRAFPSYEDGSNGDRRSDREDRGPARHGRGGGQYGGGFNYDSLGGNHREVNDGGDWDDHWKGHPKYQKHEHHYEDHVSARHYKSPVSHHHKSHHHQDDRMLEEPHSHHHKKRRHSATEEHHHHHKDSGGGHKARKTSEKHQRSKKEKHHVKQHLSEDPKPHKKKKEKKGKH